VFVLLDRLRPTGRGGLGRVGGGWTFDEAFVAVGAIDPTVIGEVEVDQWVAGIAAITPHGFGVDVYRFRCVAWERGHGFGGPLRTRNQCGTRHYDPMISDCALRATGSGCGE
jgi:hypothetical protein